jgi:uncharacterized protein VirK/YbjX
MSRSVRAAGTNPEIAQNRMTYRDGETATAYADERAKGGRRASFLQLFFHAAFEKENLKSLFNITKACRKVSRYSRIIAELRNQREILTLLEDDSLADIARLQPAFPFKFLHERYLWQGPSTREKVLSLLNNFKFLHAVLTAEALHKVVTGECVLFEKTKDNHRFSIVFCLSSDPVHLEGEMSLLFKVNGTSAFTLSFTIVPGEIVGCAGEQTILISRLQRTNETNDALRLISKVLYGITPAKALLEALQGLANALSITHLSGLSAEFQSSYLEEYAEVYVRAYDEFFAASGMSRGSVRFFHGAVPLVQKPVAETVTKPSNRSRGKHRRELRSEIVQSVYDAMKRHCRR